MKNLKIAFACTVVFACLSNSAIAQSDLTVIVNRGVDETYLDTETLRRIFFGFQNNWNHMQKIKISYTDFQHDEFWKLLNTSKTNFDQFWVKRESSGNGDFPVVMTSGKSVIDYVANTEGAIGIIQTSLLEEIGDRCKLITVGD